MYHKVQINIYKKSLKFEKRTKYVKPYFVFVITIVLRLLRYYKFHAEFVSFTNSNTKQNSKSISGGKFKILCPRPNSKFYDRLNIC